MGAHTHTESFFINVQKDGERCPVANVTSKTRMNGKYFRHFCLDLRALSTESPRNLRYESHADSLSLWSEQSQPSHSRRTFCFSVPVARLKRRSSYPSCGLRCIIYRVLSVARDSDCRRLRDLPMTYTSPLSLTICPCSSKRHFRRRWESTRDNGEEGQYMMYRSLTKTNSTLSQDLH